MRNKDDGLILLVEHRPDDAVLVQLALKAAGFSTPVEVVGDTDKAMSYISGRGKYSARMRYPLPNLILVDASLSPLDAFSFLSWLRLRPDCKNIPVVMVNGNNPDHVSRAASLGALSTISKHVQLEKLASSLKNVLAAWLKSSSKPGSEPAPAAGK